VAQTALVVPEMIEKRIYFIREYKVMLDADLAELYGVRTFNLNKAVKRNIERFPPHFMFQLTDREFLQLKGEHATPGWGGRRIPPYAFTEQGVAMLSSVLKSKRAIQVNIAIMDTFVKLRQMAFSHKDLVRKINEMERRYNHQFKIVFDAIRELMIPPSPKMKNLGFKVGDKR
jgi:phage regulator Rha-like protein